MNDNAKCERRYDKFQKHTNFIMCQLRSFTLSNRHGHLINGVDILGYFLPVLG